MYRCRVVIFLHLVSLFRIFLASEDLVDNCRRTTDMSEVDLENCLRKAREANQKIDRCSELFNRQGALYRGRDDIANFSIVVNDHEDYPANLTYIIVRRNATDWRVKNSLSYINGCERLTENDTCTLPKKRVNESLFAFFPLRKGSELYYCQYDVIDNIDKEELTWCKISDVLGCMKLELDGRITRKGEVIKISNDLHSTTGTYCFFSTAKKYLSKYAAGTSHLVESFKINASGPADDHCDLVSNLTTTVKQLKDLLVKKGQGDIGCYHLKRSVYKWHTIPVCYKPIEDIESLPGPPLTPIVAAVACVLVVALIVLLGWIHKTQLKKCSFKKNIEDLPPPLAAGVNFDADPGSEENPAKQSRTEEVIDTITFSPSLHEDDRVVSNAEKIETLTFKSDEECVHNRVSEATPLYTDLDSGFHSIKNQESSTKSPENDIKSFNYSSSDSGIAPPPESPQDFTEKVPPIMDGYTDKRGFQQANMKPSFSPYDTKDFLEDHSDAPRSVTIPVSSGYTAKGNLM